MQNIQQQHFFNEAQKAVKQKAMEDLMRVIPHNLTENKELFDGQTSVDLVLSCLVMFSRDTICDLIGLLGVPEENKDDFTKNILTTIGNEVFNKINSFKEKLN